MFGIEDRKMKASGGGSSCNHASLHEYFIEAAELTGNLLAEADYAVGTAIPEGNGRIDSHAVKYTLMDQAQAMAENAVRIYEICTDIFRKLKFVMSEELAYIESVNKQVVNTYQPLLMQLDRHKYGYQIPNYTLDNLNPDEMFHRMRHTVKNKFLLDVDSWDSTEKLLNAIHKYEKNLPEYLIELKRSVLGVPSSFNLSGASFFEMARTFLVKENDMPMRRIGNDIFEAINTTIKDINDIDGVIVHISLDMGEARNFLSSFKHRGNDSSREYETFTHARAMSLKAMLMGLGFSFIEDVIKLKINVIHEKSINYRKVLIDAYETISKDPESKEGLYTPVKDIITESDNPECLGIHMPLY